MLAVDLKSLWGQQQKESFMAIKKVLVSEPVLQGPMYDGRPFILTTDGSKEGFGAMLCQEFKTTVSWNTYFSIIHFLYLRVQ
ncbi:hypothetical protein DL96DRAFT_1473353 [Flagelloscypha sp. PMI_526]|nr:hypothetical protein DL96DRAFT_1473353 [Flagelloscypha sp. PMI_526]